MADERKCFAGDLSSDAIGKTLRLTYKRGAVTSTIEDVVVRVLHEQPALPAYPSAADLIDAARTETRIWFRSTAFNVWNKGLLGLNVPTDAGLAVDHDTVVEVLS